MEMMNLCTFSVLLLAAFTGSVLGEIGCGFSANAPVPVNDRIVNGVEAPKGAWPWIVPLLTNNSFNFPGVFHNECGGSIINKRWVVTAAHCFKGLGADRNTARNARDWQVTSGEHEVGTTTDNTDRHQSVDHEVEEIIVHENFIDEFHPHDIAIVRVKQPFKYSSRVRAICLPEADAVFDEFSRNCYAAGWGEDFGTAENPNVLQQVHSEIVNLEQCKDVHGNDGAVHDRSLCFGDGRKGTCMGDSGGPLMCKSQGAWYLAGVTSWGNRRCKGLPGVFTKVAAHRQWILDHIAESRPIKNE